MISKTLRAVHIFYLISVLILLSFANHNSNFAQDQRRVLFISSYTESFDTVPLQIEGIQSILKSNNVSLDIEYMDTRRFNTSENVALFYAHLKYKLSQSISYDAIIVGDDNALDFATQNQTDLFPETPIFLWGLTIIIALKQQQRTLGLQGSSSLFRSKKPLNWDLPLTYMLKKSLHW